MRMRVIAACAALTIGLVGPSAQSLAQSISGQDLTPEGRGAYITLAGAIDEFERRSAELALEKARRPEVKALAQDMVAEHRESAERLKDAAGSEARQYLEPPAMLPFQWEWLRDLEDSSSRRFDQEYVDQRVEAHEIAVALHRNYAANGSDAELRAFAEAAVPKASAHLAEARLLDR